LLSALLFKVGRCRLTASKPVLKVQCLWFQRLKLQYDELLSNFAFNFNLRRYIKAASSLVKVVMRRRTFFSSTWLLSRKAGRCRLTVSKPELKAQRLWFQRLKLQYDEPLSNFAFNFNLRRYSQALRLLVAS